MTIEQLNTDPIIYKTRVGAYGIENYQLMADFKEYLAEHDLVTNETIIYALAYDNPQLTPPDKCRYQVAASIETLKQTEQLVYEIGTLPLGDYKVKIIPHTAEAIGQVMAEMMTILLAEGLKFDPSRPIVERYRSVLLAEELCEICFPVN